jgi:pilus assembly protein CpaC
VLLPAVNPALAPFAQVFSNSVNALFRFHKGDTTWTGFIDALKENGLIKILAEPTLVTLNGQEAKFLAGGEFPIPVPQDFNVVTIEFKPFGVGLSFTPTVLSNNKISMRVAPEVSELDFSIAVVLQGFVVPGLTTRRAATVIELADGQSFAIAGLLRESVRESVAKFPVLGDIPILGALFRSTAFQKNETELIIIVTPHLVKPLDMARQTLPTDQYIEPSDFEWYLLGSLEGAGPVRTPRREQGRSKDVPLALSKKTGGLEGEFGYIVP